MSDELPSKKEDMPFKVEWTGFTRNEPCDVCNNKEKPHKEFEGDAGRRFVLCGGCYD